MHYTITKSSRSNNKQQANAAWLYSVVVVVVVVADRNEVTALTVTSP
jgi:hypothetical protein